MHDTWKSGVTSWYLICIILEECGAESSGQEVILHVGQL